MIRIFKRLSAIVVCVLSLNGCKAQDENPYPVLQALTKELNTKIPVLDSLFALEDNLKGKEWDSLSTAERKEIKKAIQSKAGLKLKAQSWTGVTLAPAAPIYEALASVNLKVIEKNDPFYMISKPIFFRNNTRAIVNVTMIRSYGYTYVLERTGNEWRVIKSIYNWMS